MKEEVNIASEKPLSSPEAIKAEISLDDADKQFIIEERKTIANIIKKFDRRLLVICGPCSIHDLGSAMEYAGQLSELRRKYSKTLNIVMRVCFEKPRSTFGWKGYINDPHIDNSFDVEYGLRKARSILIWINKLGLPAAIETQDPVSPNYIYDLISWSAIGERTIESQIHREMASGLSMPIGFKNAFDGNLLSAISALKSTTKPQLFMGMNQQGRVALFHTKGNPNSHLIMRGGAKPNFEESSIQEAELMLQNSELEQAILVDCGHDNCNKDHREQVVVAENVLMQRRMGNQSIIGIMLESHLCEGSQSSEQNKQDMKYGISITNPCIDWSTTSDLLAECNETMLACK